MEPITPAVDAMTAIARLAETTGVAAKGAAKTCEHTLTQPVQERRAEGMTMPPFAGKKGESLELFLNRVLMCLEAKNLDYHAAHNQARVVAMVASHVKEPVASWYHFPKPKLLTMNALAEGLRREFVPVDLQGRLRSDLQQLRQQKCTDLEMILCDQKICPAPEKWSCRKCPALSRHSRYKI